MQCKNNVRNSLNQKGRREKRTKISKTYHRPLAASCLDTGGKGGALRNWAAALTISPYQIRITVYSKRSISVAVIYEGFKPIKR